MTSRASESVGPLQSLKRWLWTRCAGCGQRFSWNYAPVTHQWDGSGPRWFKGERNLYHHECDRKAYTDAMEEYFHRGLPWFQDLDDELFEGPIGLSMLSTADDDLGTFDCWCGAKNVTVDYSELEEGCGGTGTLHCFCGGDLCVCHFHGEEQCDGCEDCNYGEDDDDY